MANDTYVLKNTGTEQHYSLRKYTKHESNLP